MLAILICNLATVAMLAGLLAGIVVGAIEARVAIRDALAFDGYDAVTPVPAAPRPA